MIDLTQEDAENGLWPIETEHYSDRLRAIRAVPVEERLTPENRRLWGDGPWAYEPNRLEWRDATSGYPCIINRADTTGALCGYVAVPPGHPLHGRDMEDLSELGVTVHGGITYAETCRGPICHVPAEGEPDDVWWIGFDAAHGGDYHPIHAIGHPSEYRDVDYMRRWVTDLAQQLLVHQHG